MSKVEETKPYNLSDPKKVQVENMFDNISNYYDFLNHFLSLGIDNTWRTKTIAKLKNQKIAKLLDVATGTADLAIEAHKQLGNIAITGLDLSAKMLEKGQKKLDERQISAIKLMQGDSENLPFADNEFDAITVAFGVRNYQNLRKGVSEMTRVLKPGGQLLILEFSKPKTIPFKQLFQVYFRYILPSIGKFTSKDPKAYQYLYESVQAFPEGDDFKRELESIGLEVLGIEPLTFGICSIYQCQKNNHA